MPWLQLRINTTRNDAPNLEDALSKCEALSVTLQDNADEPIFEPEIGETPLWQDTRLTGLFHADIDTDAVLSKIEQETQHKIDSFQWQILEDKDWEREWMTHYHPIQCHENFWICPSWTPPPEPGAVNLMLDPGLAFGTGTHPTTFLCLQWIAKQSFSNKSVIDYGCGSGILGIAALLLKAHTVVGVDIDPQAIIATKDNAERNGFAAENFPVFFPSKLPDAPADFVFANILAGPLIELAKPIGAITKPGGKLCLSGILQIQESTIVSAYSNDFEIEEISAKDGWACITASRK